MSTSQTFYEGYVYLTDRAGNLLTDRSGKYLIARDPSVPVSVSDSCTFAVVLSETVSSVDTVKAATALTTSNSVASADATFDYEKMLLNRKSFS